MMQEEPSILPLASPFFWILAKITILAQVGVLVHVVKTGRPYWWAWIIFGFPILGSLAYLYFEVLPERRIPSLREISWMLKGAAGRVAALKEQLEEVDTMNNRLLLARELSKARRFAEAAEVIREGLSAAHTDDGYVMYHYAEALMDAGDFANGEAAALKIVLKDARELTWRRDLLLARAADGLGRDAEAEERYRALLPFFVGEAARGYFARFLAGTSRVAEARELWADTLKKYRKSTKIWRRSEKPWFLAAKLGLRQTQKAV